ncbi:hypothetical protein FKM82_019555 [Ascaphus truei]
MVILSCDISGSCVMSRTALLPIPFFIFAVVTVNTNFIVEPPSCVSVIICFFTIIKLMLHFISTFVFCDSLLHISYIFSVTLA